MAASSSTAHYHQSDSEIRTRKTSLDCFTSGRFVQVENSSKQSLLSENHRLQECVDAKDKLLQTKEQLIEAQRNLIKSLER